MSSRRGKDKPTNAAICVFYPAQEGRGTAALPLCKESGLAIFAHERGIPRKRESPTRVDQFGALCTHHLLLPFVHTTCCCYRSGLVKPSDCQGAVKIRPNLTL